MSSEESSEEEGVEVLKIKKPTWRKPVIDDMTCLKGLTVFPTPLRVHKQEDN